METEPETAEAAAVPDTLAGRLADGDPDAPRELVERHHAEIYRYALAMLRDPTAAEDAAQASFERAFGALGRYPEGRIRSLALRAWLYRIALNVVRNMVRDERREVAVAEVPEEPSVQSRTASGPKGHAEAWLDAAAALGKLPERQRVAVALRYLADLPYAEIAEAMGWPENTAKTLARRGVGRLRALMLANDQRKRGRLDE
jgi:RNA polymerase sigma-70 factor (ECF subfamily)